MRKTFLLTSIILLSASWALAQYSSGSSQTDQQSTSGSQSTGAYGGSSAGSQTTTNDVSPGAQPSSSDTFNQSSSDQDASQSRGGYTSNSGTSQTQGTRSEGMSSQQGETNSDMGSQSGSQTGTSARTSENATSGRTMTFEGCLSEANGKFHLTDKMGTSYELTGKTANLKSHVGHTIAVTGKASSTPGANQPGAMSGEQAGMEQTIQVSSFKHVSGSCRGGSMSSPGTGSSPHKY